ncbi:hypothetical protein FDA39_09540 [Clostridium botulinum]|nr:hypothetical protein [Clostridium botulinum]
MELSVYIYENDGTFRILNDLITNVKYTCSLDKIAQQVDITLAYSIYSNAFPSIYIGTGQKVEVYIGDRNIFKGKAMTSNLKADKEELELTCYDYIWYLTKSKVVYNFNNISAFNAVCKIFNDLEIPYSADGILGGPNGEGASINIEHLVKNKSAYDACMMIATEVHNQFGIYYYMFMDVAGNVNLMECDRYWSKQTIKPCSDPSLANPDGTMIALSDRNVMSDMITRVQLFDSKGNAVDIETGESAEDDEDEGGEE